MPTVTGRATDFIRFSRASNATGVDSDGKIKWAPHNLLLASEQFDASSWTKTTTTVAANSVAAPSGSTTAETLTAGGANSTVLQSYTSLGVAYTFGVWLKRKTGTGNVQIAAASGTYTTVTITSDWALYTVSQTPAAGTISAGIRIITSADEVYAWGAHLYRSDLGGMQANTSAYPMYNPTTPKNLLGYTESFDNAAWNKGNILAFGSGSVANAVIAPNGLQTADLLVESTANGLHTITQAVSVAGGASVTASVYLKKSGRQYALVYVSDAVAKNYAVLFDLNAGTVIGNATGLANYAAPTSSSITDAGNGWFRCSVSATIDAIRTQASCNIALSNSGLTTNSFSYTGDGTSGIYLWGAQLSDSASLDPYVPNYFAAPSAAAYNGPRLDYDPATLAAKGLLIEEQRTNLLVHSAAFNDAAWNKALGTTTATITANAGTAPDGSTTADLIYPAATGIAAAVQSLTTPAASLPLTASCCFKASGIGFAYIQLNGTGGTVVATSITVNLSTGAVGTIQALAGGGITSASASVSSLGNGWYRLTLSGVLHPTNTGWAVYYGPCDAQDTRNVTASGSNGVLIWGAQLEAGSFATSYIPTGSATATRSADVASVATSAFPFSASASTLVASFSKFVTSSRGGVAALAGSSGALPNSLTIDAQNDAKMRAFSDVNNTNPYLNTDVGTYTANTTQKLAIAYAENNANAAANGTAGTTDTSAGLPVGIDLLQLGAIKQTTVAASTFLNGHIRQITYLPRRLSNAELQARTV